MRARVSHNDETMEIRLQPKSDRSVKLAMDSLVRPWRTPTGYGSAGYVQATIIDIDRTPWCTRSTETGGETDA